MKGGFFPCLTDPDLLSIDSRNALVRQKAIHYLTTISLDHCLGKQVWVFFDHTSVDIGPLLVDLDAYTFTTSWRVNGCPYQCPANSCERIKYVHPRLCEKLYQLRHKLM